MGLTLFLKEMGISGLSKSETKLEVSKTIHYIKVKRCLARTPGPDMDHLLQAAEDEGLLCHVEVGHLGGGVVVWSILLLIQDVEKS